MNFCVFHKFDLGHETLRKAPEAYLNSTLRGPDER